MDSWLKIIQKLVFPPTCVLCGAAGTGVRDLCHRCAEALPYLTQCCPQCALPLDGEGAGICGRCVDTPPCFDASFAPLAYVEPVRYMVAALKFRRQQVHARLLGTLLADRMADREVYPEVLIPVPLHPSRLRERRFNPSAEIARVVSHRLAIPLDLDSARRLRATPRQVGLPADQRARNVRNAFFVRAELAARHVAIVDDVMTTGATVNELARTLRKAGVDRIEVWACARALL